MQSEPNKSLHPLIWVAGIAVILFCGAGIAALMGWLPTSIGNSGVNTTSLFNTGQQ